MLIKDADQAVTRSERSRVFVIQDNGMLNFEDAERFGRLIPMLVRDAFPDDADERLSAMLRIMRTKLFPSTIGKPQSGDFDPTVDYMLLVGDPIAIFAAGMLIAEQTPYVRCLKWDRDLRMYYRITVDLTPSAIHIERRSNDGKGCNIASDR